MQINIHELDRCGIDSFADRHGLVMELHERKVDVNGSFPWITANHRWYAHFNHTETKEGPCLVSTHGNGPTQQAAIVDYARQISGKLLVINAFSSDRKEIQVPILTETGL